MTTVTHADAYRLLDEDQLVEQAARPIPRAQLGNGLAAGLWALRVFTIVLAGMVICAFVLGLRAG